MCITHMCTSVCCDRGLYILASLNHHSVMLTTSLCFHAVRDMTQDFKYRRDELDHRLAAKKMENERAQQEAQAAAQKKQQEQEQES